MTRPTTIRLPEDLVDEIDRFAQELKIDRSVYLREILRKGLSLDRQDRLLDKYRRGELSQSEVCSRLDWSPWEFLSHLREKKLHRNVDLEDWMDAAELPNF